MVVSIYKGHLQSVPSSTTLREGHSERVFVRGHLRTCDRYHRKLMNAILFDKVRVADAVNVKTISLDEAPQGYAAFDAGASVKYVIDPHGMVGQPKFNKVKQ
jgi:threonine dehydrogenase-like Zn-dependent dehydrogenase